MAAKKKYYAVRNGRTRGILETWAQCEQSVKGFSGAKYKSFLTREEAEAYLAGENGRDGSSLSQGDAGSVKKGQTPADPERDVIAYVDGSFDPESGRYGYGCIFLTPEGEEVRLCGSGSDPGTAKLRNVAGEMLGAMNAVRWAVQHGYASMEIRYDYEGIENWATGAWQARNPYTIAYADYMKKSMSRIELSFWKVLAHSGNYYNEEVDQLAKASLIGNPIPDSDTDGKENTKQ